MVSFEEDQQRYMSIADSIVVYDNSEWALAVDVYQSMPKAWFTLVTGPSNCRRGLGCCK